MTYTIAAYSGGVLPAAIGIIRITGEQAFDLYQRIFRRKSKLALSPALAGKLQMGTLLSSDGREIDLCMGTFFCRPKSYTGEDMCEIYCHGSAAVVAAAPDHCFLLGAHPAEPGEFTKRAFLNGKLDLIEAEAVADLIDSTSTFSAQTAVHQLKGSVHHQLTPVREELASLLAHFYAVCDYPDEDLDPFEVERAAGILERSAEYLNTLSGSYQRGKILSQGVPVAIVGRPNAGKSTLFNALAGFSRAIVTEEEGTTRDTIDQVISCNGAPIRMIDTAGIRTPQSKAEKIGIEKTKDALASASAVLWVVDNPLTQEDLQLLDLIQQIPWRALILNKNDLGPAPQIQGDISAAFDAVFTISAAKKTGLSPLINWLADLAPRPDEEVLITSARQASLLHQAAEDLKQAVASCRAGMTADIFLSDAERALNTLGKMTGDTASADIAKEIFSRFCVGK